MKKQNKNHDRTSDAKNIEIIRNRTQKESKNYKKTMKK